MSTPYHAEFCSGYGPGIHDIDCPERGNPVGGVVQAIPRVARAVLTERDLHAYYEARRANDIAAERAMRAEKVWQRRMFEAEKTGEDVERIVRRLTS